VLRLLTAITIAYCLHAVPAQAQLTRTYVSGSGNDGNPCTVTSPCQTIQAALALTVAGGEIYALNSANYGSVTINRAVSISGGHGTTGVLAASVNGVTINAGPNDIVNLRGLDIDGAGSGTNGVQFNSGASLNIYDSVIRGFTNGINYQPSGSSNLSVGGTLISNNSTGISFQNATASTGVLNDVQVVNNGTGIVAFSTNSTTLAILTVQSSVVANNSTVGILSNGLSNVAVSNSTIANNGVGLEAQNTGALLQVSGSTVTGNGTGWLANNTGQVISSVTNSIGGNTTGNTAPPTSVASSPTPTPPPPSTTNYLLDSGGNILATPTGNGLTAS
jgi:hypothetical protein